MTAERRHIEHKRRPAIAGARAGRFPTLIVVPIDTAAVGSELQKTWNRKDAAEWAKLYAMIFPSYQLLIESYAKAQEVEKKHEQLDLQRVA